MRVNYETDDSFNADAYCVQGWRGVAWHVLGWATEPDEDTEWSGYESRTGMLVCRMVGDDAHHFYDPEDVEAIPEDDYCHECGQIGCTADGRER